MAAMGLGEKIDLSVGLVHSEGVPIDSLAFE